MKVIVFAIVLFASTVAYGQCTGGACARSARHAAIHHAHGHGPVRAVLRGLARGRQKAREARKSGVLFPRLRSACSRHS